MTILLSTLLRGRDYRLIAGDLKARVKSIENDSRRVGQESLFVAITGGVSDGHSYIADCIAKGCSAVAVDKKRTILPDEELIALSDGKVTVIEFDDTRSAIAGLCARFYGNPEDRLDLIGITGTKGKTTVSFMIHEMLKCAGRPSGLIGTVCSMVGDEVRPAQRTTPESLDIYKMLDEMARKRMESCVMEVSSHGLKFKRVGGLRFDVGCFTNFFEDHIGPADHPDMEDYLVSKLKLFDQSAIAVINSDCNEAQKIASYAGERCTVYTYGMGNDSDCYAENIRRCDRDGVPGTLFDLVSPWYDGEVFVSLPGLFNVYNALCAICVAGILKMEFDVVLKALSEVRVPGRVQPVKNGLGFGIVVDYAHNAGSLQSVIEAMHSYASGRVITVFGCGGDRSPVRRPEMGEVSGRYSDFTVITSDNPRSEDPMKIIDDILAGIDKTDGKYVVEPDRKKAIEYAISEAKPGDIVLIAGKGHEDYQEINGKKFDFDDVKVASEIVSRMEVRK